jgi:hypothetical protein
MVDGSGGKEKSGSTEEVKGKFPTDGDLLACFPYGSEEYQSCGGRD